MADMLQACEDVMAWQRAEKKANRSRRARCLECVRAALGKQGLTLPRRPWPDNTAIGCFEFLVQNPEKWGWKQIHSPLTVPCLVFFKNCGRLPDRRVAGHVAIYDPRTGRLYSNNNANWSQYWADHIVGAFVPA